MNSLFRVSILAKGVVILVYLWLKWSFSTVCDNHLPRILGRQMELARDFTVTSSTQLAKKEM